MEFTVGRQAGGCFATGFGISLHIEKEQMDPGYDMIQASGGLDGKGNQTGVYLKHQDSEVKVECIWRLRVGSREYPCKQVLWMILRDPVRRETDGCVGGVLLRQVQYLPKWHQHGLGDVLLVDKLKVRTTLD